MAEMAAKVQALGAGLRPEPHRGDVVAAGAVVLAALVALLQVRFDGVWASGVHLACCAAALAFVATLALRAPREGAEPRTYQSVLLATTFALAVPALGRLAQALGADGLGSAGALAWVAGALAALAFGLAAARASALCVLLGAVSLAVALVAFVEWAFAPTGPGPVRWLLLVLALAFTVASVAQRDRRPRRAVALADAAGLSALALALSFSGPGLISDALRRSAGAGAGWELFLYACGFGLCAYAAVERAAGPGWIGVAVLLATTLAAAGGEATVVGWPLVLALGAGALLATGLRPSRPLPPAPARGDAHVYDIREER
jgi:hypothetical protein